ncbi:MAG: Dabb family protein [Dongiaceae bacterium]
MIRHCVFVRFRREVGSDERVAILRQFAGLKGKNPGLRAVHIGANVSPESGMDKRYSEGFVMDFRGARARGAYLAPVEHQAIGRQLLAAPQGGIEGVLVYDIEVAE